MNKIKYMDCTVNRADATWESNRKDIHKHSIKFSGKEALVMNYSD
jgi:hypothetical protein